MQPDNLFVQIILFPTLFAILVAGFEAASSLFRGVAKGDRKYRAWLSEWNGQALPVPECWPKFNLEEIRTNPHIIDLDLMGTLTLECLAPLGFDLVIGAMAVDAATYTKTTSREGISPLILIIHLFALLALILLTYRLHNTWPGEVGQRSKITQLLIGTGLVSLLFACLHL